MLLDQQSQPAEPDRAQEGVVVVVIRRGRFLMIQRAANVLAGGAWCFVGGAIEYGETQEQAVRREFDEELGGRVRPVKKVWEWVRSDGRLRLHWWLAELVPGRLTPNPAEVAEWRWVQPSRVSSLPQLLPSNRAFLDAVGYGLIGEH